MKRFYFFLALFAFLSFSFTSSSAQEPPMKWGEIPMSDLQMKSFPQDTNATALILGDYGESSFNDDLYIVYKRHLRVKILTAKGYDWGTHSVSVLTDDHTEWIKDIEGITYSLDEKGNVVKNVMDDDAIFEEEINDSWTRYRFTLPSLQPGCVIELRYTITANNISRVRDWVFQYSEPVRWSEYRLRMPKTFSYAGVTRGFEPFAIDDNDDVTQVVSGTALSYLHKTLADCSQRRWAVKNAPAIREEPFITTIGDYLTQVDLQLAGYALPEGGLKRVLNDWPTVVKELLDNKYFYGKIDDTRQVRKLAEKITAGLQTPEEKMRAIYNWVSSSVVWSGENRVFAEQDVDDLLESKKGSSAEISFLLISLLNSAGISADPVIFSTRSNGAVQNVYPIISQFNYVVPRAVIGTKAYLLDATDPNRPMDLLPVKILGTKGLLVRQENWGWVGVSTDRVDEGISSASISISEDGSISGKLQESLSAYSSLRLRGKLSDKKESEIAKDEFDSERTGITLDSVQIVNKDSLSLPLNIQANFTSSSYAQKNGDLIYLNPQIIDRMWENPFKTAIRRFPVDYAYKRKASTTITINIPEGYEVKEKLKDISTFGGARALSFTRQTKVEGNKMTITCNIDVKETQILPKFYEQLRDFYAAVVSVEAEQIVLSKIPPQAPAVTTQSLATPGVETSPKKELPGGSTGKKNSKTKKGKN